LDNIGLSRTRIPLIKGHTNPAKIKRNIKATLREEDYECCFKSGIVLDPTSAKTLIGKINKINSVWAKTLILRFIHGDQPYNSKFFLTGYSETPNCEYCFSKIEDFNHKYVTCLALNKLNNFIRYITDKRADNINDWITMAKTPKVLTIIAYMIRNVVKIKDGEADPIKLYESLQTSAYVQ